MTEREIGFLIQLAFSSAVLAREFRRLEAISAFEVSILVLNGTGILLYFRKNRIQFQLDIPVRFYRARAYTRDGEERKRNWRKAASFRQVSYCGSGPFVGESRILTLFETRENRLRNFR